MTTDYKLLKRQARIDTLNYINSDFVEVYKITEKIRGGVFSKDNVYNLNFRLYYYKESDLLFSVSLMGNSYGGIVYISSELTNEFVYKDRYDYFSMRDLLESYLEIEYGLVKYSECDLEELNSKK